MSDLYALKRDNARLSLGSFVPVRLQRINELQEYQGERTVRPFLMRQRSYQPIGRHPRHTPGGRCVWIGMQVTL